MHLFLSPFQYFLYTVHACELKRITEGQVYVSSERARDQTVSHQPGILVVF